MTRFSILTFLRPGAAAFLAAMLLLPVHATLLQPISEDQQIEKADTIFRGKVQSIDVAWDSSGGARKVVSTVSFLPLTIYKGSPTAPIALKFLGGKIDGKVMKVDGMPQFVVGQEYILFVSGDSNRACPVVGWSDGSLKIDRQVDAAGRVAVSPDVSGVAERAVTARSRTLPDGVSDLASYEGRLRARIEALKIQP